ncbi:hypothetical protein SLEP1_g3381 [Rubroshorea leprosula]|uniref:Uncharacterized protein n=1 Tax=Rubroshorea leprosula TaxID=152421 RepID=A0AAV5HW19_9ROSI|nr:hypothetical protein SLEP1_g3381 [Rubroshorea leprosula]
MAEHDKSTTLMEKIVEKIQDHNGSSSSSSDEDDRPSHTNALKSKIYRIFGREKPVHKVLGGGKRSRFESQELRAKYAMLL